MTPDFEPITIHACQSISKYYNARAQRDWKQRMDDKLQMHIAYQINDMFIQQRETPDLIERSLDVIVMHPSTFWRIVNHEARKLVRDIDMTEIPRTKNGESST